MRKIIIAVVMTVIAYSGLFDCEDGGGTAKKPPPQVTDVTGNLIISGKSNGVVTTYRKWKTNFMDSGPYGEDRSMGAGANNRVAGFCVPANTTVEGKMKGGIGFEFGVSLRPGDCRKLNHLDVYRVTVKKG